SALAASACAAASFATFAMAAAFSSAVGGGNSACAGAIAPISSKAASGMRTFFTAPPSRGDFDARDFARGPLARLDVVVPVLVVLLRPSLVDVAGAHRAIGAFEADGSQIDVPERKCDVEKCRNRMNDPRVLHHGACLVEVREQQDQAAPAHGDGQPDHAKPEPALLPRVEAP